MSATLPKKGDIIINPSTQRPVKVGSRTWLGLVKQGLIEGRYSDPKELYEIKEWDNVDTEINNVNKSLPRGQQAVRGRGKFKGKIVSRNKQLAPTEVSRYTAQVASRAVSNNIEKLVEAGDDIEGLLEQLILAEMVGASPVEKVLIRRQNPEAKRLEREVEQYRLEEPEEYDYDEVEAPVQAWGDGFSDGSEKEENENDTFYYD